MNTERQIIVEIDSISINHNKLEYHTITLIAEINTINDTISFVHINNCIRSKLLYWILTGTNSLIILLNTQEYIVYIHKCVLIGI